MSAPDLPPDLADRLDAITRKPGLRRYPTLLASITELVREAYARTPPEQPPPEPLPPEDLSDLAEDLLPPPPPEPLTDLQRALLENLVQPARYRPATAAPHYPRPRRYGQECTCAYCTGRRQSLEELGIRRPGEPRS